MTVSFLDQPVGISDKFKKEVHAVVISKMETVSPGQL
jgi:hypothetical protein